MKALYLDLDGTLLGQNGSLLHTGDGEISFAGAQALLRCLQQNIEVVLLSGRREAQVKEAARLFGQSSYIFEAGAAVVFAGETHWLTGEFQPGAETIHDQIAALGAPKLLLSEFAGALEYHDPWHRDREVSHLFRGSIDLTYAQDLLDERYGKNVLRLLDNGVAHHRSSRLSVKGLLRVYHLVPAQASKACAVQFHAKQRGYLPQQTSAVGDSREDLCVASSVGTFWLVGNALEADTSLVELVKTYPNVQVTEARHGAGVFEAVCLMSGGADLG